MARFEEEVPVAGWEQIGEGCCGIHAAEIAVLRPVWYSL